MNDPIRVHVRIEGSYAADPQDHPVSTAMADHHAGRSSVEDVLARLTADTGQPVEVDFGLDDTTMSAPEMLAAYSRALDEIYALRRLAAYAATAISVDLDYKSFPKSRREAASSNVANLRAAARGEVESMLAGKSSRVVTLCLLQAGADACLTRHQFEVQRGLRNADGTIVRRTDA